MDTEPPLLTKRVKDENGVFFRSVSQGREKPAEEIGPLIQKHFNLKIESKCYYNGVKVTHIEYISLKQLEKQ